MTAPPPVPSYDETAPADAPRVVGRARGRSSGEGATEWVEQNGRAVGGALVVGAVAIAAIFAWRSSEATSAARAERSLYEAESRYAGGDPGAAQALQQVSTRYSGTAAAAHARVLLAQTYYDRGQYAEGLRALGSGDVPPDWREATERLRAVGEVGSGRPKDAASTYESLARDAGPDTRAMLLADAARAYDQAGDAAGARRAWHLVLDSGVRGATDEARVRLGELEASGK